MENSKMDAILKSIRKEFYALRNGMLSDTLRKGGLEQKYIFGLQIPQIKQLADQFRPESSREEAALARELWKDRNCRESRLLACHLMPPFEIDEKEATEWGMDATTREEADILAFRLLRHLSFAPGLSYALSRCDTPLRRYTAEAIRRFL